MTTDQNQDEQQEKQEKQNPEHYTGKSTKKTITNWGQTLNLRAVVITGIALVVIALLLIVLSTCSAMFTDTSGDADNLGSYGILQQRVDEAFSQEGDTDAGAHRNGDQHENTRHDQDNVAPTVPGTSSDADERRDETPTEQLQRQVEQEQDLLQAEEELRQQKRDQIPSPLTENPPAPAKLGPY